MWILYYYILEKAIEKMFAGRQLGEPGTVEGKNTFTMLTFAVQLNKFTERHGMKTKTIKRHIVILDDSEVKMIFHALTLLENQKAAVGTEAREQLVNLRRGFYELIKPGAEHLKKSMGS